MAFDEDLAARIRERLGRYKHVEEKRMFGGLAFLVAGHLTVAVRADSILARLGPDRTDDALREPHVRQFVNGGRAMKGWVVIAQKVLDDDQLNGWIERAVAFVGTLPAK